MSTTDTGGPAFPTSLPDVEQGFEGMSLRDWFAATIQYDKDLMEDISRCDDQDLVERFGTEAEKDDYFDCVLPGAPIPFKNIELRARLEARARAVIRYREADAMLAERWKEPRK